MAELKTRPNDASVAAFLDGIEDDRKREDARTIAKILRRVTGTGPKMWGESIVGYGSYRYEYDSGQTGEWFLTGFSPRKQALTVYVMAGFDDYEALLAKLGKHKTGRSCLYLKKLDDVDLAVLEELVAKSVAHMKAKHG